METALRVGPRKLGQSLTTAPAGSGFGLWWKVAAGLMRAAGGSISESCSSFGGAGSVKVLALVSAAVVGLVSQVRRAAAIAVVIMASR